MKIIFDERCRRQFQQNIYFHLFMFQRLYLDYNDAHLLLFHYIVFLINILAEFLFLMRQFFVKEIAHLPRWAIRHGCPDITFPIEVRKWVYNLSDI